MEANKNSPSLAHSLLGIALAATAFTVAGQVAQLTAIGGTTAPLWLAAGVGLAALLRFGLHLWPGILLGAALLALNTGLPLLSAMLIAIGSTLSLLLVAYGYRRLPQRQALSSSTGNLKLVLLVAGCSTISAYTWVLAIGTASGGPLHDPAALWMQRWLSEALGVLVVAPLAMLRPPRLRSRLQIIEAAVLGLLVYAAARLAFSGYELEAQLLAVLLLWPLLVWTAARFAAVGVAFAALAISLLATTASAQGLGPFGEASLMGNPLPLQLFIAAIAITGLLAAAMPQEQAMVQAVLSATGRELEATRGLLRRESSARQRCAQAERRLAGILDATTDFIGICNYRGELVYLNPAARALCGVGQRPVADIALDELLASDAQQRLLGEIAAAAAAHGAWRGELALRTAGGEAVIASLVVIAQRTSSGRVRSYAAVARDIGSEKQLEQELKLAASVFEQSPQAIMITCPERRVLRVNRSFSHISGYEPQHVLGRRLGLLSTHATDAATFEQLWEQIQRTGRWQGELSLRRESGATYPVWCNITSLHDESAALTHYIVAFIDITEQKLSQEHIHRLAHYDVLTNLPNRRLLQEHLNQYLHQAKRSRQLLALAFLDIDQFKVINDSLGHGAGDSLLEQTSRRLSHRVRQSDVVARWGGDEFAIILQDVGNAGNAANVAQQLLDTVRQPFVVGGQELFVTASIGITLAPTDGDTSLGLLRNADSALHRAKLNGRNSYQFFTAGMTAALADKLALRSQLHKAVDREQLLLHFQPQLDAEGDGIVGFEALLRWDHPQRGLISPAQFIPIAEDSGQIVPITHWVIRAACRQQVAWQRAGLGRLRMAVNISGRSFQDPRLCEVIADAVRESGIDPALLELELTETFLVSNPSAATETLRELKAVGVQIAIDDFGIGYSSLSYLKRFAVDRLKVDQSFVRGLPADADDAAIVRAIIAMAKNLQLRLTAEGVETAEQLEFLRREGCDEVQGFYFSRPLPAAACAELLRSRITLQAAD